MSLGVKIGQRGLLLRAQHLRSFSSQTSASEATEALGHVSEEVAKEAAENVAKAQEETKKKVSAPMLDRDRSYNLTYAIASQDKLEAINKLLYASYHPDEPITKALGLYKGPGSIPDADRRVEASIKRNLSLFAYDKDGKEIGVCINNGYYRHDFMEILDNVSLESLQKQNIISSNPFVLGI